jgi:hypothetical protein
MCQVDDNSLPELPGEIGMSATNSDKSFPEEIGMSAIHSDGVITLAVCFDANGPETRQSRKSITSSQNS